MTQQENPQEKEEFSFDWDRIETMLGTKLRLAPARTAKFPTIHESDNISQITRKVMKYVAKTQNVEALSDQDVADLVGMKLLTRENAATELADPTSYAIIKPDRLLSLKYNLKIDDNDRIVQCINKNGNVTLICTGNSASKTGTFRTQAGRCQVENLSQYATAYQYGEIFKQRYPQHRTEIVDWVVRNLSDKTFSGKKYESFWDERQWDPHIAEATRYAIRWLESQEGELQIDPAAKQDPQLMSAHDMRELWNQIPIRNPGNTNAMYTIPGYHTSLGVDWLDMQLSGKYERVLRRAICRDWRAMLEKECNIEYEAAAERAYVRDQYRQHSATVFQEKKNINPDHKMAAAKSIFARSGDFKHVELDDEINLATLQKIETEYKTIRPFLTKSKSPTLRFRKTGRHKALGVYHPHVDNIAVDPRHPESFIHEYAHHLDYTLETRNLSMSNQFNEIKHEILAAIRALPPETLETRKLEYWTRSTEIFARSSEMYYYWQGVNTSLNGDVKRYATPIYQTMTPLKNEIINYWDQLLTRHDTEIPTAQALQQNLDQLRENQMNQAERAAYRIAQTAFAHPPTQAIKDAYQPSLFEQQTGKPYTPQTKQTSSNEIGR